MKETSQIRIIQVLLRHPYSAIHEIGRYYQDDYNMPIKSSDNAIGSRLPEMAKYGYVHNGKRYYLEGRKRLNMPYSEWRIATFESVDSRKEEIKPIQIKEQIVMGF